MATLAFTLPTILGSADQVGDPSGTRTVTSIIALLVVLAIGLLMLAVWLFRVTRPDPELLAPLELMGERRWRRSDPVWQRRRLDEVRPAGAEPLQPSAAPPDLDAAFDDGPSGKGFDDLHDDQIPAERPVATPPQAPPTALRRALETLERRRRIASMTPKGIDRPRLDDLPAREFDPGLLAAAIAELDEEMAREMGRDRPHDEPTSE